MVSRTASLESDTALHPSEAVTKLEEKFQTFLKQHKKRIITLLIITFVLAYTAYFIYALVYSTNDSLVLIVITCLVIFYIICSVFRARFGDTIRTRILSPAAVLIGSVWRYCRWAFYGLLVVGFVVFIAVDVIPRNPQYLMSLVGIAFFVLVSFIFSTSPSKINWHTMFSGVVLQLFMGLLVIRWTPGQKVIRSVAGVITSFMHYSSFGAKFVFGESLTHHSFAMEVMTVIIWFSAVTELLYYYGIIQVVIATVGGFIAFVMATSPAESFVAVANIFLGPETSILAISSMVPGLSTSEIHSLMASGLATMGGALIAVFESFGIPASHVVSASFMSAPAVLAISKTLCPEESKTRKTENLEFDKRKEENAIVAFSNGAGRAVAIIASVLSILISFLAILEFINTTLIWMGDRIGVYNMTFERILGWLFTPMVFLMGVEWADCQLVAELVGLKTVVNEFVAYVYLADLISNRKEGLLPSISERSEAIAAYALCGFSNLGTVGMVLGFLSIIAPMRKGDITAVALRSLVSSSIACFMTACVAGLFYIGVDDQGSANATTVL